MREPAEVLRTLCDLHAIEEQGNAAPYDEQRRVRNEMRFAWHEARLVLGLPVAEKMEPTALDKRSEVRKARRAGKAVSGKE